MAVKKDKANKNSPNGIAWLVAVAVLIEAIAKLLKAIEPFIQ